MMKKQAQVQVVAGEGRARWVQVVALCLLIVAPQSIGAQQSNITFTNIPDFLRLKWEIVLGADQKGEIVNTRGSMLTGNAIMMLSNKPDPKVVGDYTAMEVDTVTQYNSRSAAASAGYRTLFQLMAKTGDAILYPGSHFWTLSVRYGRSGPYTSYVAILTGHEEQLRDAGLWEQELESQRKILKANYSSLAKGID